MEWFGIHTQDRSLIDATYQAQARGESLMLVAETNGVVCGQAWVDLSRLQLDGTGVIWALRVFPCLQNKGIGTRLVMAAENALRERGFRRAELSVDRGNTAALRLYRRLGYEIVATMPGPGGAVTTDPVPICVPEYQDLLRKNLSRS